MTKPVIVTRSGKGVALTYEEQDANFTNLQNATITVSDGTNSKAIDLNGTIQFTAGTNVSLAVNPSTGAVTINSTAPVVNGTNLFGSINPTVYTLTVNMGVTTVASLPYDNTFVTTNTASGNNSYFNFNFTPSQPTRWRFLVNNIGGGSFIPQALGVDMLLGNTGVGSTSGKTIYEVYYLGSGVSTPSWAGTSGSSWIFYSIKQ